MHTDKDANTSFIFLYIIVHFWMSNKDIIKTLLGYDIKDKYV